MSRKHQNNDPNQALQLRRGNPKTVQIHRVLKFHKSHFQEPNVRTIV